MSTDQESFGSCPICAAPMRPFRQIERFKPPLEIGCCDECRFEQQSPAAIERIESEAETIYGEGYYSGAADFSYRDERRVEKFDRYVFNARLDTIAQHVAPPGDFVDIGCAFGGFLETARDRGYRVRGLDISPYAAKHAAARGIEVVSAPFAPGLFNDNSTDVVTMIEVIEHLGKPRSVAAALGRMIRPDGVAVIQTANFDGCQAKIGGGNYHYYLPGHLCYYNKENLIRLLRDYGFDRFHTYLPVDFGLWPKLMKSRGSFKRIGDYLAWLRIAHYHYSGKLHWGNFAFTSSMVLYARRSKAEPEKRE